ncbi:MAG: hypothetical protein U9P90_04555, partial [Patescibacteria group bacterium]|nr:hypothetical protein [Patescibacteria group bacterium]
MSVDFLRPKFKLSKKRIQNLGHGMFVLFVSTLVVGITLLGFYGNLTGNTKAAEGINKQISYQGKLLTSTGAVAEDANYNIKFVIYDSATLGTCLWTVSGLCETPDSINVEVANGYFSVLLGGTGHNAINLDFNDDTYWLGITVGSDDEMTPRKRIGAAGYAFNADTLDGLDSTSFLRTNAVSTSTSQTVFATVPDGLGVHQGSLYVNPSSASTNYAMLGVAVAGVEKLRIDSEGDLFTAGSLNTSSTLLADGLATFYGSVDIGNDTSDTLTITARIDSDVDPATNNYYDIGQFDDAWKDIYASGTIYGNTASFSGTGTSTFSGGIQASHLYTTDGLTVVGG